MAYDKTNTGILSRNERKEKDTHPDFAGAINVDGVDYWLSGWVKERNDGTGKFFSLAVKPKEQSASKRPNKPSPSPAPVDEMSDDIPF